MGEKSNIEGFSAQLLRRLPELCGVHSKCIGTDEPHAAERWQPLSRSRRNACPARSRRNRRHFGSANEGCAEPCKQHLRSVLEAHFGILYILQNDSERRGLAYHIADIHRRIKIYRKADPSEPAGQELRKAVKNEHAAVEVLSSLPPIDFQAKIQFLTSLLQSASYQAIDQEWQRTKMKHKGRSPAWHALFDGPKTVREMAFHLNKAFWYEIQYGEWSDVIHAGSGLHHVGIDSSDPTGASRAIRPLRHPDGLHTVLDHVAGITIELERNLPGSYLGKISQNLLHDQYISKVRPSLEPARRQYRSRLTGPEGASRYLRSGGIILWFGMTAT